MLDLLWLLRYRYKEMDKEECSADGIVGGLAEGEGGEEEREGRRGKQDKNGCFRLSFSHIA